ncbi:hypothetical protein RJ639_041199 [Escallonia herrerae]|uniref:Sulfotransferase n=1 Tax=Escallonia herrerae TaxID=1293975 RepID=A0AA89B5S9_9ASTE|nr:hypothetical protein RJ639_041199 [Escallonia herrerae]
MPTSEPPPTLPLPKYLEEYELAQECRDLISSLPKERGWLATHLYRYQGFWHNSRQLGGVLGCQQHFQAQDTDVLLVTTPKSGTTWLKAIMFTLVNRIHSPVTHEHPLLTNNPHELVPFLELKLYVDTHIPNLTSFSSPRLFSTHLPFVSLPKSVLESGCKLVYLCRDPRDTFVSLWHFTNKLRPQSHGTTSSLEEVFDKFCRGVSLCGPFWDHVLHYWKESLSNPEKIFFLKYEDMKEHPQLHLRRLAEFIGCPFSPEEETKGVVDDILGLCSFDNLSKLKVNVDGKLSSGEENKAFFRQGEVGDWKNYLTAEMVDQLDKIGEEKFYGSGLKL